MRSIRVLLCVLAFFLALAVSPVFAANVVINHSNWDSYDSASSELRTLVSQNRYFFAHASVGSNIVEGLNDLNSVDSATYMLATESTGDSPPSTSAGTLYEYARGNPGWAEKVSLFSEYVGNGWQSPQTDFAINKFCYIDQDADFATYRDSMASLESAYPNTIFVYMTIPLTTDDDSEDGYLRQQFNASLRDWIDSQDGKCLIDIADIEAYSPGGEEQTSSWNGNAYQKLYAGYTDDGGHLNSTGRVRVATAFYSLFSGRLGLSSSPTPNYLVIFSNSSSRQTAIVNFSNTSRTSHALSFSAPDGWSGCCSCDFDDNGSPDQVWRNQDSGQAVIVSMSGTSVLGYAGLGTYPDLEPKACGDFNGDGNPDVVWRDPASGTVSTLLMSGTTPSSWVETLNSGPLAWSLKGAGDFNADGTEDLVFRNASTGQNAIVLLSGAVYDQAQLFQEVGDPGYDIFGAADVDDDGGADILWFNAATGNLYVEYMNGQTHESYATLDLGFTIPSGWEPVDAADY